MSDSLVNPKRNVFSAVKHKMESCVKKVNMNVLNGCLENPCLLFTFSMFTTLAISHFFSYFPSKN